MMKRSLLLASGLLLAATDASADAPTWCNVEGAQKLTNNSEYTKAIYSETNARTAVQTLVTTTCYPDDDARAQGKQIEAVRVGWSKKLDMLDADWADAALWAQNVRGRDVKYPDSKGAWSAYSPIDQYGKILSAHNIDASYLTDAFGAKLTEPGRLGYIMRCLETPFGDPSVRWAMCDPDIAAFDRAKFATDVRSDTSHNGSDRMQLRFAAHEAIASIAKHATDVKELIAKDPAYAKLFAISDATRKAWSPTPALIELATKMDDARVTGSRKVSDGCDDATWAAWKTVVGAIPAKQLANPGEAWQAMDHAIGVVVGQPSGYLAGLAMFRCAMATKAQGELSSFLIGSLGAAMKRWPGFRGPRTATQTAIVLAGITLDDSDAKLKFPDVERDIEGGGGGYVTGTGAIASVKVAGDVATITFANVKVTQTVCAKGRTTNRITQIRSDGGIVFEYICTERRTETITVTPSPPLKVAARSVVGLVPGMVVEVSDGLVIFAFTKGNSTTPVMVAGVGVK